MLAIIKRGKLTRKQSIDLLEGLDFDFMNVNKFLGGDGGYVFDGERDFLWGEHHMFSNDDDADMLLDDSQFVKGSVLQKKTPGRKGRKSTIATPETIELSMYADKAAQLSSGHLDKSPKGKVFQRGMAPASMPPRPLSSKGSIVPSELTWSTVSPAPALGIISDFSSLPTTRTDSAYPFIVTQNQIISISSPNFDMSSTSNQDGFIGVYSPENRRKRIEKFLEKRSRRVWTKKVKYDVRKNFADSRLRVKGRFVKKEDEEVLREVQLMDPF